MNYLLSLSVSQTMGKQSMSKPYLLIEIVREQKTYHDLCYITMWDMLSWPLPWIGIKRANNCQYVPNVHYSVIANDLNYSYTSLPNPDTNQHSQLFFIAHFAWHLAMRRFSHLYDYVYIPHWIGDKNRTIGTKVGFMLLFVGLS